MTVEDGTALGYPIDSEQGLQELGPAGSHEPCHPYDLAGVHLEGDIVQLALRTHAGDLQQHVAALPRGARSGESHGFPRNPPDDLLLADFGDLLGEQIGSIPENRYPIRYLVDLLHAVGYVNDADALFSQVPQQLEKPIRLLPGQ